ncbi:MAG TPA: NYN domain-containing protein [Acidobacteriota bacterium]|nr:NYN domain-containing protein [Acidobacteriota bacterium]
MPYWFDGNNLTGQSAEEARKDNKTREAFLRSLMSYRQSGHSRFLVYFDGDDPGRSSIPPGISIRYSAPESADAAIVRRLREIERPYEVIVVTNDHELSAGCRRAGASTLSWKQFLSKMQSRAAKAANGAGHRTEDTGPIDVEEWLNYFGLDKK